MTGHGNRVRGEELIAAIQGSKSEGMSHSPLCPFLLQIFTPSSCGRTTDKGSKFNITANHRGSIFRLLNQCCVIIFRAYSNVHTYTYIPQHPICLQYSRLHHYKCVQYTFVSFWKWILNVFHRQVAWKYSFFMH